MYVAHYVFYVACILRGCDMSTGFYTNIWIWIWSAECELFKRLIDM